jgi:hypothetical protein
MDRFSSMALAETDERIHCQGTRNHVKQMEHKKTNSEANDDPDWKRPGRFAPS